MSKIWDLFKENKNLLIPTCGILIYCLLGWFLNFPCPIKFLTGISCPGCGMSRAAISLLAFDYQKALYYHPGIFLLIPFAIAMLIANYKKKYKFRKIVIICLCFMLLAIYLYRILVIKSPVIVFDINKGFFMQFYSSILKIFC